MITMRQRYDPLKPSDKPRWLARLDMFRNVVEVRELPPGANLRGALAQDSVALRRDGWTIEGVSFTGTFVRRADVRHYLGVYPADPQGREGVAAWEVSGDVGGPN
jgi:hypothetical protein